MDKGYEKEQFTTISFKCSTVKKFRDFSKKMGASNSMTLLNMLEFFQHNGISPKESIGPQIQTLESLIKKRINGVIAIMKDIEKNHHKPTTAILQTLFEETSNIEKQEEVYDFDSPSLISENEELTYYRNTYFSTKEKYNTLKYDVEGIIKKTKYIKSNFGAGHFRLDITKEEFENLKQNLKNVHHHNSAETRR